METVLHGFWRRIGKTPTILVNLGPLTPGEEMNDFDFSEVQQAWMKLTAALRKQVEKKLQDIPQLDTAELNLFTDAIETVYRLELNSQFFDKQVDLEMSKFTSGD